MAKALKTDKVKIVLSTHDTKIQLRNWVATRIPDNIRVKYNGEFTIFKPVVVAKAHLGA